MRGLRHLSESSTPLWNFSHLPDLCAPGRGALHRQRQNLLYAVQFGSEFRQADMHGKQIREVLRQRGRTRSAPALLKSFSDYARWANHDYFSVAFGLTGHKA